MFNDASGWMAVAVVVLAFIWFVAMLSGIRPTPRHYEEMVREESRDYMMETVPVSRATLQRVESALCLSGIVLRQCGQTTNADAAEALADHINGIWSVK